MRETPSFPGHQLSMVVFGPGFGECIVIKAPPDDWLVVDSFVDHAGVQRNPAIRFLDAHGAKPSAIVLTHPHEDHAAGFVDLIERWPEARIGYVPVPTRKQQLPLEDADAERGLRTGIAEHAAAAIADACERSPERRWILEPRAVLNLGEGAVIALGPSITATRKAASAPPRSLNDLSAPLAIQWRKTRIVLGAELPAVQWQRLVQEWPASTPGDHHALKVPHHGSKASVPKLLADPADDRLRTWILSPWQRAGGSLPRFEDGEGVDLLLRHVPEIHLTALPTAVQSQRMTRAEALNASQRHQFGGRDLVLRYEDEEPTSQQAWVAVSYDDTGALVDTSGGDASLVVTR